MLDCVLISRNEAVRRQVSELLGRPDSNAQLSLDLPSSSAEVSREVVTRIVAAGPQVVVLDLGESTTGLRVVQALGEDAPEIALLVTGPALSAEQLLEVMRGGAAEYLPQPLGDEDLAAAFHRLRRRLGSAPVSAEARGRIVSVFSAKGGVGVTTVAANLAVMIARRTSEPTLFLDLNPSFGTGDLSLGVQPRYSYLDVIRNFHRIDLELLESFLETHDSGVAFLAAPTSAASGDSPEADQIIGLLRLARRHFRHVVVDAGSRLGLLTPHILAESDELLMVVSPEIPTLRNTRRVQDVMGLRHLGDSDGPRVILNQRRDGVGVTEREVEEVLGHRVFATLDWDDEAVVRSLNMGDPLGDTGRSRFAKGMGRLGDQLLGEKGDKSGGRFSFLKSLRISSSDK